MTIGQTLGIISHTFSITNDAGDKVQLTAKLDCRTATDNDIKGWITSNRIIAGQRPWRSLSKNELLELNNTTFVAQNIGQKVKSKEQIVQEGKAAIAQMSKEDQKAFLEELMEEAK